MFPKQILLALLVALLMITVASTDTSGNIIPSSTATPSVNNTSASRDVSPSPYVLCKPNLYLHSSTDGFDSVIDHLNSLTGNATLGHQPGGGWCYRYSCDENLGLYACNDRQTDAQVPWSAMAAYAKVIKDKCTFNKNLRGHSRQRVWGQAFDVDGWNVILGLKSGTNC